MKYNFPENFIFSIATSSYQTEGAANLDGNYLKIDTFFFQWAENMF